MFVDGIIDWAVQRPISVNTGGRRPGYKWLVNHIQVGYGDLFGYYNRDNGFNSANLWLAQDGTLVQYASLDIITWTQADGNTYGVSCECEGVVSEPLTYAQMNSFARLYSDLINAGKLPLHMCQSIAENGLAYHRLGGRAWSPDLHSCPGDIRIAQLPTIIDMISQGLAPEGGSTAPIQEEWLMTSRQELQEDLGTANAALLASIRAELTKPKFTLFRIMDSDNPNAVWMDMGGNKRAWIENPAEFSALDTTSEILRVSSDSTLGSTEPVGNLPPSFWNEKVPTATAPAGALFGEYGGEKIWLTPTQAGQVDAYAYMPFPNLDTDARRTRLRQVQYVTFSDAPISDTDGTGVPNNTKVYKLDVVARTRTWVSLPQYLAASKPPAVPLSVNSPEYKYSLV